MKSLKSLKMVSFWLQKLILFGDFWHQNRQKGSISGTGNRKKGQENLYLNFNYQKTLYCQSTGNHFVGDLINSLVFKYHHNTKTQCQPSGDEQGEVWASSFSISIYN